MTVAEMIDEIIRVVSKKEERFEGILDTASLKELNNHYDQMSSSVSESKVPDLGEARMKTTSSDVVQIRYNEHVFGMEGEVYWEVVNRGPIPMLVQLPKVIREKQPTPSFDSYSVHTGEIKI